MNISHYVGIHDLSQIYLAINLRCSWLAVYVLSHVGSLDRVYLHERVDYMPEVSRVCVCVCVCVCVRARTCVCARAHACMHTCVYLGITNVMHTMYDCFPLSAKQQEEKTKKQH